MTERRQAGPDKLVKDAGEQDGEQERGGQDDEGIDHQTFEAGPDVVAALVVVGEEGQDAGEIVALGTNFDETAVEFGKLASADGFG